AAPGFHGQFYFKFVSSNMIMKSDVFIVEGCRPSLEDEEWLDAARRGHKNWMKKLRFTKNLQKVFSMFDGKISHEQLHKMGKKPCDWWDRKFDRDLLIAFLKHGFGRSNDFKNDDEFCFDRKLKKFVNGCKTKREKNRAE